MLVIVLLIVFLLLVGLLLVCRLAGEVSRNGEVVERYRTAWTVRDAERRMEHLVREGFQAMLDSARRGRQS
jgi:uncharacterized membrane protein